MLTVDRLHEVLVYDPESGHFTWRISNGRRAIAGHEAGFIHSKGYRRIKIDGALYEAHRLAFLFMTGAWPAQQIDHRDCDPSNNRWKNLRPATHAQNMANVVRPPRDLPRGVSRDRHHFVARISVNGERIHLGVFDNATDAAMVYRAAAADVHGEFARSS